MIAIIILLKAVDMIQMIIAHLIGDWILQPRKMAVAKGEHTLRGWLFCFLHVSIYTLCFVVLVPHHSFWFYVSIFIPHFIIDKWSLMGYWIKFRDGVEWWKAYEIKTQPDDFYARLEMGFAGIRYALEDNTAHLVCLYLTYTYL